MSGDNEEHLAAVSRHPQRCGPPPSTKDPWGCPGRPVASRTAVGGFSFYGDGTVERVSWFTERVILPRSPVLDVALRDGTSPKNPLGRALMVLPTQGLSLLAPGRKGTAAVTIVTRDWAETIKASDAGHLDRLVAEALLAKARATGWR